MTGLLDLPAELRNIIYEMTVVYATYKIDLISLPGPETCASNCPDCIYPPLTRVGGPVGAEALSTFFSANEFVAKVHWLPHNLPRGPSLLGDVKYKPRLDRARGGIRALSRAFKRLGRSHCRAISSLQIVWLGPGAADANLLAMTAWADLWARENGSTACRPKSTSITHSYFERKASRMRAAALPNVGSWRTSLRTQLREGLTELAGRHRTSNARSGEQTVQSRITAWIVTSDDQQLEEMKSCMRSGFSTSQSDSSLRGVQFGGPDIAATARPSFLSMLPQKVRLRIYDLVLNFGAHVRLRQLYNDPLAGYHSPRIAPHITFEQGEDDLIAALPPITQMRNSIGNEALAAYLLNVTFDLSLNFSPDAVRSLASLHHKLQILDATTESDFGQRRVPLKLRLSWKWPPAGVHLQALVNYANLFCDGGYAFDRYLSLVDTSDDGRMTQIITIIRLAIERRSRLGPPPFPHGGSKSGWLHGSSHTGEKPQQLWKKWSLLAWINEDYSADWAEAIAICKDLFRVDLEAAYAPWEETDPLGLGCDPPWPLGVSPFMPNLTESLSTHMEVGSLPTPIIPILTNTNALLIDQLPSAEGDFTPAIDDFGSGPIFPGGTYVTANTVSDATLTYGPTRPRIPSYMALRHPSWQYKGCSYPFEECKAVDDER